MIISDEMPKEGHFVAVWNNSGSVWSDTHRYIKGQLHMLTTEGEWKICNPAKFYATKNAQFITEA